MKIDLKEYKTWIFDCDGVIFDSNRIKTEAFYEVALPYGKDAARAIVKYHKKFGGVSRFKKWRYFFENILNQDLREKELKEVLRQFGKVVKKKMATCPESEGLRPFLRALPKGCRKIVVSGSAQHELRGIFAKRGLTRYFDGIYGSPDTKEVILARTLAKRKVVKPAIFVGDTIYDYACTRKIRADFVFMYGYTELENWRRYFRNKKAMIARNPEEITRWIKKKS